MSILAELQKRGIEVSKTDIFRRGYYTTPKGVAISKKMKKCEKGIYLLKLSNGKTIPCGTGKVYFVKGTEYENANLSLEEADKLVEEGKLFGFKMRDLYKEYYDFKNDPELECCCNYGYSCASRKYIESVMNEIGMIDFIEADNYRDGKDGEMLEFDVIRTYRDIVEIGKLDENTWVAQTTYQFGLDDLGIIKMCFNHMPTDDELRAAFTIRNFTSEPIEVYKKICNDTWVNWLDFDGDITEKYIRMKELIENDCE